MATAGATATGFASRAPKLGFIGGFDGVRGLGILCVLANHAYSQLFPSMAGFIDIFFVMSAFLIVSLLMQEYRENDGIDFRKFYARRGIRLLPSAYLCLLAWIVLLAIFDRERLPYFFQEAGAAVLYVYNIVFPVGIYSVAPEVAGNLSIDHFWSLAMEEQFYLVVAVTVLVMLRRRWVVQLAVVMVVLAVWIGWSRWTGNFGPWPGNTIADIGADGFSGDPATVERGLSLFWLSRPDALMWGVALAVLNAHLPDPLPAVWRRWLPRVGLVGAFVALGTMLLSSGWFLEVSQRLGLPYPYVPMVAPPGYDGLYWIQFGHTVVAISFAAALLAMTRVKEWRLNQWLSWKPFRSLGRQSYTLYVWHTLVYWVILDVLSLDGVLGEKTRVFLLVPAAVLACFPIFRWVEQPLLKAKLRFSAEKQVLDLRTGEMVDLTDPAAAEASAPAESRVSAEPAEPAGGTRSVDASDPDDSTASSGGPVHGGGGS